MNLHTCHLACVMHQPSSSVAVQLVFQGMTWKEILTYLDNLNVIGNGLHDHLQNLRKSFKHLHKYQLKLKPCKCCLFKTEVPFLVWLVSNKGVAVDPYKIKAILEWPVPKSRNDMEAFLGFVNYHQDHIKPYLLQGWHTIHLEAVFKIILPAAFSDAVFLHCLLDPAITTFIHTLPPGRRIHFGCS